MTGPLVASGALFLDDAGRLLVVEPTYKSTWEIPGGRVEAGETPRDATTARLAERVVAHDVFVVSTLCWFDVLDQHGGGVEVVRNEPFGGAVPVDGERETVPAGPIAAAAALRRAGVPLLAGTDATPFAPAHGAGMHRELELLTRAGLSNEKVLAAATSVPARHFGLTDRGRIVPGFRADLVLVAGDPTQDITATSAIVDVWRRGVRQIRP